LNKDENDDGDIVAIEIDSNKASNERDDEENEEINASKRFQQEDFDDWR
jgi:hypothetical protein